jgi:cation/acetate symporter
VLGRDSAWFPLRNPALVTIPLSFLVGVGVSLAVPERDGVARHRSLARRMHLGVEGE